jgi:hypothetical protein
MRKPTTRPPKPTRRPKLIRPTLAEEIEIARGIAADPDARALKRGEIRRMRPFVESVTLDRIAHARRGTTADAFLTGERRMRLYLEAAQAAARALNMPSVVDAARKAIERARARIANHDVRPR